MPLELLGNKMLTYHRKMSLNHFKVLAFLSVFVVAVQVSLLISRLAVLLHAGVFSGSSYALPAVVVYGLVECLFAHIALWLGLVGLLWLITRGVARALSLDRDQQFTCCVVVWVLTMLTLLMANLAIFPRSVFSGVFSVVFNHRVAETVAIVGLSLLVVLAAVASFAWLRQIWQQRSLRFVLPVILASVLAYQLILTTHVQARPATRQSMPNIIIVGIDSLRLSEVDHRPTDITPLLNDYLDQTTHFTNALTPLGRTYPAWISILTGQYPKHNGARFDLIPTQYLDLKYNLADTLRQHGYQTIYATDEKRFSTIDKSYGFDTLISPEIGFNDFLIGLFNDFPLSNLVVNTRLGKWLFPFNYINRSDYATYYPDTFTKALQGFLAKPRHKPMFLAVHFCLSHFPYTWGDEASSPFAERTPQTLLKSYKKALRRTDIQFNRLMMALKRNHILDNALVVVLSDHGESLGFPAGRLTSAKHYVASDAQTKGPWYLANQETLEQSYGHGTDVLSPSQDRILLAMRLYGSNPSQASRQTFRVSLLDIKPTLADLLNLDLGATDGRSLLPYVRQAHHAAPKTDYFFLESGFIPKTISPVSAVFSTLLKVGVSFYEINKTTGYLQLKSKRIHDLIIGKQHSVYFKHWLLAMYPSEKRPLPVLVDLQTGRWTDNLKTAFAEHSPATQMLQALKHFYGAQLTG